MSDVNCSIFTGNLVRDCEVKTVNGVMLAKISIACNNTVATIKDGKKEFVHKPFFLNTQIWGMIAENLSPFLKKGIKISVQGHWENYPYEKNGKKILLNQFKVANIQFISPKKTNLEPTPEEQKTAIMEDKFIDENFEIY